MTNTKSVEHPEQSIVQAIETLSRIIELNLDNPQALEEAEGSSIQEMPLIYETVHWLHKKNAERIMKVVKETYKVILHYLKNFYEHEYGRLTERSSAEGIKTIMVLVGEAAKKVDRYSKVFMDSSEETCRTSKEFRDLYDFYKRKIAPIVVQDSLSRWIRMLPVKAVLDYSKVETGKIIHGVSEGYFLDLDTVVKDSEFELFFIKKQDGSQFYTSRLIRNMQLIADFEETKNEGILFELKHIKDDLAKKIGKVLMNSTKNLIEDFLKHANKHLNDVLVKKTYKIIYALMLTCSCKEYSEVLTGKTAVNYLFDFHRFFRELVASVEYQKCLVYAKENSFDKRIIVLCETLAKVFFENIGLPEHLFIYVERLFSEGLDVLHKEGLNQTLQDLPLSERMNVHYQSLVRALHAMNHVPMLLDVEDLQNPDIIEFNPMELQIYPHKVFTMDAFDLEIPVLCAPVPLSQHNIHVAYVLEEWKEYIRSRKKPCLVFNISDRTNWKELARCNALEELDRTEGFKENCIIATFAKGGDFYNQEKIYETIHQSEMFFEHVQENIESIISGFYIPTQVMNKLKNEHFIEKLIRGISIVFFQERNILTLEQRRDFIEIFQVFCELKIIEIVKPSVIFFCSKDGLDAASTAINELYTLIKIINDRPFSPNEEENLGIQLFGPTIMERSRPIFEGAFHRLYRMIRLIEDAIDFEGSIAFRRAIAEKILNLYSSLVLSSPVRGLSKEE